MNYKAILKVVGKVLVALACLMLIPIIFSFVYKEEIAKIALIKSASITFGVGILLLILLRKNKDEVYSKEGAVLVGLVWILVSIAGAMPYMFTKEIPFFVDALFETVSGFTTTGASILTDVEALSKSTLLWRSLTQWIGGMGVLVFLVAFFNRQSDKSMNFLKSEMPGPIKDKLLPKTSKSALVLYGIYLGLTALNVVFLMIGHMSFYEALVHTFATVSTGGFGIKFDSIASYSPYIQYVLAIFMVLSGINFNVYFLMLVGKIREAFKYRESNIYTIIVLISSLAIALNILGQANGFKDSFRYSFFTVSSIMTTTGFATVDFNFWPSFSKILLLILMIIGGCAGSTAGGLKVSRVATLFGSIGNEFRHKMHPRSERVVKMDGKEIEGNIVTSISTYIGLSAVIVIIGLIIISLTSSLDILTNLSGVLATFNNIGPGLNEIGPAGSYAVYGTLDKIVLILLMLLGRLEIYPLLIALSPFTYRRK